MSKDKVNRPKKVITADQKSVVEVKKLNMKLRLSKTLFKSNFACGSQVKNMNNHLSECRQ